MKYEFTIKPIEGETYTILKDIDGNDTEFLISKNGYITPSNTIIVEIWKPIFINGEKTHYLISDYGRIKNSKKNKILKPKTNAYCGYKQVDLSIHNVKYQCKVHRLVAEAFIHNPGNKKTVDHIIVTSPSEIGKAINTVFNLRWATQEEQAKYAISSGARHGVKGSKNHLAKMDELMAHAICKEIVKYELSIIEISKKLNIPSHTITDILDKRSWIHISSNYDIDRSRIPSSRRGLDKEDLFKIFKLRDDGYTYKYIADQIDNKITSGAIRDMMNRPGSYKKEKEEYALLYKNNKE